MHKKGWLGRTDLDGRNKSKYMSIRIKVSSLKLESTHKQQQNKASQSIWDGGIFPNSFCKVGVILMTHIYGASGR